MAEHKLRALVSGLTPWFFNKTKDNTIEGHTYPDEASTLDLGSSTRPFRAIYADSLIGDASGTDELAKVSAADGSAGYLEDKIAGVGPISLATSTSSLLNISLDTSTLLLRSGTNSLTGNLSVSSGITIDGVDLGSPGNGIEIVSNGYAVDIGSNSGLTFSSGELVVNPASTLTLSGNTLGVNQASTFTWTGQHQFNVAPDINANLDFIGGARTITASSDLTIDPTGTLYYPLAQNIAGVGFEDNVTGIKSFRHYNPSGLTRQLTIGRIKADELYVRVFTADEERVNRGAEFWARSYGIVETTFEVPAMDANVDVYFEEVPGLDGAKLFLPNNWILFRTVDVDTGLTVMKVWFQVVDADGGGTNDYVSRADADEANGRLSYQVWRLKRKSGGLTGAEIKKGNVGVDFGIPADFAGTPAIGQFAGQGVVALSALSQDSGPYIQIQTFDTITGGEPDFLNRVRMGNLDGILGYDREADGELFGFAAGNDLALDVDSGDFSGVVIDQINGLRMYNTEIKLFDGANDLIYLNPTYGLGFQVDTSAFSNDQLYVSWYTDLANSATYAAPTGRIGAWGDESDGTFGLDSSGILSSTIRFNATGDSGATSSTLLIQAGDSFGSRVDIFAPVFRTRGSNVKTLIGATSNSDLPISRFHVLDDNDAIGESGGIIIEQSGTGDSMLHWYTGSVSGQWFTAGIDTSDGGKWKLSASNFLDDSPFIIINPSDGSVVINGLDLGAGTPITGLTSGDGSITISGSDLIVNSAMYTPTTRTISAGGGLTGGGNLSANRTLAVDFSSVVSTSVSVGSGAGLTGGGNLTTSRTLAVGAGNGITVNADDVQINFGYSPTWTGTHTFSQDIQLGANLDFTGGNRQITGSNSITMTPTNDLIFTPGDDVILTTTKIFKSSDYATSSSGITGFAFINNGASNKQLDINTIRADQLRAETFVADATRVDVGEEYWGKSMGIINANLTTPSSIGGTTFIYFEDSAALQDTALFSNNDWILIKTVTAAGAINEFWGQVSSYTDQGTDSNGKKYQRWTFTLRSGPTNTLIKSGNVAVGFGAAGQGYVHLTTLDSDNGPFIEIGKWGGSNPYDGVSDTTNVRMGNLNGAAGISGNEWGFATGNNLALTPSTGFSGMVSSATDGVQLYNTNLVLYDGSAEVVSLTQDFGLKLRLESSASLGDSSEQPATISWFHENGGAWIHGGLGTTAHTILDIGTSNNDSLATSEIRISSYGHSGDIDGFPEYSNTYSNVRISSANDGYIYLGARKTMTFGSLTVGWYTTPDVQGDLTVPSNARAALHVMKPFPTGDISYNGILVEDGYIRYENASGDMVTTGIDESDGDNFKMAYATNFGSGVFLEFNPTTGITTIAGLDGTAALDGVVSGAGITITGAEIAVNSTVVRTTREIATGYGLIGGDTLDVDLSLEIDTSIVVINTRTLTAGAGLTGGGNLTADRTFNIGAGDGITVNTDSIEVDSSIARSAITLTAGSGLTGGGNLTANRTFNIGAGAGITVNADDIQINLGTNSGLDTTSGLVIDSSFAGNGLTMASGVLNVVALSTGGLTANANDLQIKLPANSGLITDSTGLYLPSSLAGAGLALTSGVLSVNVASGIAVSGDNIILDSAVAGTGLAYSTGVLSVNVTDGLTTSGDNIILASSVAGLGLAYSAGVLSINATDGLTISGDSVILASSSAGVGLAYTSGVLSVNATTGLTISGDNVILASTVAGDGLMYTGGVLDIVAANGSITVGSDNINVNLAHAFNWTGVHTFADDVTFNDPIIINDTNTFNSDPQIAADIDFISGARSITGSGNITIAPTGDLILAPTGQNVLPNSSYVTDLGDYNRKWRTLYAAELYVETLVAQDVSATLGGRIMVAPTTSLVTDINTSVTTITVKHNGVIGVNDYIMLQNAPAGVAQFEVMKVTASLGAGGGGYQYTVTRNSDSSGANSWLSGDSIVNLGGAIGEGYLDISSTATLYGDIGPTITVYARNGTSAWNDIDPVTTMGNLSSFVDYGSDQYGFAAGNDLTLDGSSGFSGFTVDRGDGLRMFNTEIRMYESGDLKMRLDNTNGLVFQYDDGDTGYYITNHGISWVDDVISPETAGSNHAASLAAWRAVNDMHVALSVTSETGTGTVALRATSTDGAVTTSAMFIDDTLITLTNNSSYWRFDDTGRAMMGVGFGQAFSSRLLVWESTNTNTANTGVTIQNFHADGDSMLHFYHDNGSSQRWVLGTDRSDSNKFKISETAGFGSLNHVVITPSTGLVTLSGALTVGGNLTMPNGSILIAETIRAVDSSGLLLTEDGSKGILIADNTGYVGINNTAPGVDIVGTYDYTSTTDGVVDVRGTNSRLVLSGGSSATIDMIDFNATTNNKWLQLLTDGGTSKFRSMSDAGSTTVDNILSITHSSGDISFAGNLSMANAKVLTVETLKAVDSSGIIFKDDSDTTYMTLTDATGITTSGTLTSNGPLVVNSNPISYTNHSSNYYSRLYTTQGYYISGSRINVIAFDVASNIGVTVKLSYSQFNTGTASDEPIIGLAVGTFTRGTGAFLVKNIGHLANNHATMTFEESSNRLLIYLTRSSGTSFRNTDSIRIIGVEVIGSISNISLAPSAI